MCHVMAFHGLARTYVMVTEKSFQTQPLSFLPLEIQEWDGTQQALTKDSESWKALLSRYLEQTPLFPKLSVLLLKTHKQIVQMQHGEEKNQKRSICQAGNSVVLKEFSSFTTVQSTLFIYFKKINNSNNDPKLLHVKCLEGIA